MGSRSGLVVKGSRRHALGRGEAIRRAAEETGTRLIDLEQVFIPLCSDQECLEWLFKDHHPNVAGHQLVARTLVDALGGPTAP